MATKIVFLCLSVLLTVANVRTDENIEVHQAFKAKHDECAKEVQIDKEIVNKFFKEGAISDDKKLKCFFKCMHIKMNFMNDAGEFNVEELKKVLLPLAHDKAKAAEIIDKCTSVKNSDPCESSFNLVQCVQSHKP